MFGMSSGSMPTVMKHNFSQVPSANIPRSQFNRSHGYKTTFDAGHLIPVFVDEALPGDTFNLKMSAFARLATPVHPFMDNLYLDSFFFFVPNRLLWTNWEKFNGEQTNPGDSTSFLVPTLTSTAVTGYDIGSLWDYFGIPTGIPGLVHNALHSRAYNLIWNEWFRDQNLQNSAVVDVDDGPDTVTDYVVKQRGKRHDYFTSALPFLQKGTAATIPLGTTAPLVRLTNAPAWQAFDAGAQTQPNAQDIATNAAGVVIGTPVGGGISFSVGTSLYADLSTANAVTINALRLAVQTQKLLERDARGGTRYTEIIRSHFGVVSPDARLQRPEFLGGSSTRIMTSPIPQTSETDAGTPQGNLAAMGTVSFSGEGHGFVKSFTEHGVVLGMIAVRADLNYQQGLNRMWFRQTRYDFYWPVLSHIGEQSILNKEIYAQGSGNPTQDAAVFGYQERYAEYRYKPSQITGLFRSTAAGSLDNWHLAEEFTALPVLNASFIVDSSDDVVDRVSAVPTEPNFLLDAFFDFKTARPMPTYSVPGLIDHF